MEDLPAIKVQNEELQLEQKIKFQITRRNDLSQWEVTHLLVTFKIKVRVMEDLIDKAQGVKDYKSDEEAKLELERLQQLKDQTFQDLQDFVREREKHHWRNWDKLKDTDSKFRLFLEEKLGQ